MTVRLEHIIKPFMLMSEDEQLDLVRKVRHNRFVVQPSKAKTATKKTERKASHKKQAGVKALLAGMSPEERAALIAKLGE